MNEFTIYCTEEQTLKALELGAPIDIYLEEYDNSTKKDNEFQIMNDIVFSYDEDKCCNEEGYLVLIIGKKPNRKAYYIPTAEQMIGWLEEQGILIDIDAEWNKSVLVYVWDCENKSLINNVFHGSRKEATIAAIDAALEYLSQRKEE